MEEKYLRIAYKIYPDFNELPDFWQNLVREAQAALPRAYAPYSQFKVGAAFHLSNDQIVTGTNQENAAYPSGLCAERTALFHALSTYPDTKIKGLAVVTSVPGKLAAPCGGCRQVLVDAELNRTGPYPVLFPGENGTWLLFDTAHDLFPFSFNL